MTIDVALIAWALSTAPGAPPPDVAIPRIEDAQVVVDGVLDEAVWRRAAQLRGFWQYLPVDDRPAADSTVVLVWYAPGAIYFGIQAWQDSATVRATLADRDRITGDDHVQIVLDTFNDRRRGFLFAVNPLGVQADGTLQDAARQSAGLSSAGGTGAYAIDLSQDYVFQSKGRIVPGGYQVEIRIPFETLRYQTAGVQTWGINVIRRVQASGHEHTWTRVLQTEVSFLGQGGTLTGLAQLRPGLVLDFTPEATSTVTGGPDPSGWDYSGGQPSIGLNARWGITSNLTLNGTANPDFSQIEADVAQLQYDPREALFFPEKRPFFLDGLQYFSGPTSLVYTRRLADPIAAVKLTGKAGRTGVAYLSGVDSRDVSLSGTDHPVYNMLRVRQDLGPQNTAGLTYTDRVEGDAFNRVAALDGRIQLGRVYALTAQAGGSLTRGAGGAGTAFGPFWNASLNRAGRHFGLQVSTRGFADDFETQSGFLSRGGIAYVAISPSITTFGAPGAALERWSGSILLDGRWDYRRFMDGEIPNDPRLHFNTGVTLKGGWEIGGSLLLESFKYPAELYAGYAVERTLSGVTDTIPFTGTDRLYNLDVALNLATPRFQQFSADLFVIVGRDDNFFEWSPAFIAIGTLDITWRPSEQIRINLLYNHQHYVRLTDWSTVGLRRIPRLKLEYQLTRAIFVRFVGQYDSAVRDSLRDDSRTDGPILISDGAGGYRPAPRQEGSDLRFDWLFSYRPLPGTVFFAGYGSSLAGPDAFGFRDMGRVNDGFFLKLSYLFRV